MKIKTEYGKINKNFCGRKTIIVKTVGDLKKELKKLPDSLPIGTNSEEFEISVFNVSLDNPHLRIQEIY